MTYSKELEDMCYVRKGVDHGPAPIPEEGKWVKAKEIKDISGLTHGVGWCAPQQGACKLTLNIKDGIIHLRITVVVGSLRIPFSRFRKHILEGRREFLLPNGEIILLPDEWFSQYAGMLEMGVQTDKGIRLKRTYGGMLPSLTEQTVTKQFPDKNRIVLVPAPKGLKAKLRPYQQKGFSWMVHLSELNFGGCLADDMGLGKTLQTLTLLQHFYKQPTQEETIAEETKEEEACTVPPSHQEADSGGQFQLFSDNTELLPQTGKQPDEPAAVTQRTKSRRAPRKPSSLIVVPTSLLHNWRREAKRFTTLSATEYNSYTPIPS